MTDDPRRSALDGPAPDVALADPLADDLPPDAPPGASTKRRKSTATSLLEWLVVVAIALASAMVVQRFVVQQFVVDGHSMDSTLHDGDRVLVNKLSYRLHDPRRGDVVVLKRFEANNDERDLIKRVIGLPGDTVEIRQCVVYIDGRPLDEPYLDDAARDPATCGSPGVAAAGDGAPLVIGDDQVFVLGDNRGGSGDGRMFGPIDEDLLIGRAFVVIWPLGDWGWL